MAVLEAAARHFRENASVAERRRFEDFCFLHANWLDDFALFMALKQRDPTAVGSSWKRTFAQRSARHRTCRR